ncbi:MAG: VPLPA-CTERM sorting domain-containing protein [Pseudomonadales bacterium]|nr:VPLPA-CTERM sorting domain-containing protein [Pseudomonadales bacterium]
MQPKSKLTHHKIYGPIAAILILTPFSVSAAIQPISTSAELNIFSSHGGINPENQTPIADETINSVDFSTFNESISGTDGYNLVQASQSTSISASSIIYEGLALAQWGSGSRTINQASNSLNIDFSLDSTGVYNFIYSNTRDGNPDLINGSLSLVGDNGFEWSYRNGIGWTDHVVFEFSEELEAGTYSLIVDFSAEACDGLSCSGSGIHSYSSEIGFSMVSAAPVPLPASIWFLLTSLATLTGLKYRKNGYHSN